MLSFFIEKKETKILVQKNSLRSNSFWTGLPPKRWQLGMFRSVNVWGGRPDKNSMRKVNSKPEGTGGLFLSRGFSSFLFPKFFMPLGISLRRMQKEQCLILNYLCYIVVNWTLSIWSLVFGTLQLGFRKYLSIFLTLGQKHQLSLK